jgi:hypothetical protein
MSRQSGRHEHLDPCLGKLVDEPDRELRQLNGGGPFASSPG